MRYSRPFNLRGGRLLALSLVTGSLVTGALAAPPDRVEQADADRYQAHVEFLASPEMKGRGAGTPELEQAAEYIAKYFKQAGLEPAGEHGSYLQPFEVTTGAQMGDNNSLEVERKRGIETLDAGADYVPINFSSSGEVEGSVAFAGYGVSAEEFEYDDYTHFDVTDKIVVVLRYEPDFFEDEEERGEQGRRRRFTRHSHLISKAINARDRGAKAVLLVDVATSRRRGSGRRGGGQRGQELIKFGSIAGPADAGIPVVQVKSAVVEKWFRGSGRSLKVLRRDLNGKREPQSFDLAESVKIRLKVDVKRERATIHNVAGYLPGTSDEYVVFGAHYDHLGLGDQSSLAPSQLGEVHHGADDNASGTAGLIELARRYGADEKPNRGALFLAFAGEEIGLLGSAHWVEHPTLPIENAAAMFNMDMVGRVKGQKLYVGGTGTADAFEGMLDGIKDDYSFQIDTSRSGYSASDHTSFVAKNIPVLFFFSGLHSDYHKPSDTADKINSEAAVELLGLVATLADGVMDGEARPEFVEGSNESAHGGQPPAGSGGGGGYGPWFGSVPDFGEVPEGVKFADVRPGSPAAKAGLKAGDILTGWNEKPIANLYDFTYALRDSAVGDVIHVKYLRDGEARVTDVKLVPRP